MGGSPCGPLFCWRFWGGRLPVCRRFGSAGPMALGGIVTEGSLCSGLGFWGVWGLFPFASLVSQRSSSHGMSLIKAEGFEQH